MFNIITNSYVIPFISKPSLVRAPLIRSGYMVLPKNQALASGFIYLGFYVAFNTVQVISRWVAGRAEETSTYSSLGFCTVNCRPTASNYQLSHLRPCRGSNPGLRGGRRECYHSATVAPSLASGIQSLLSKNAIERVKSVKSLGFSSTQASPKVEASNTPKQAQHLPTCR